MSTPEPILPRKLRRGDTIRVIAPALSRSFVAEHDHSNLIDARFAARSRSAAGPSWPSDRATR